MTVHVFAGEQYYPSGGSGDHVNSFDSAAEAVEWIEQEAIRSHYDWWEVCEATSLEILFKSP